MTILKIPVTKDDHIQGNNEDLVTLVEYGDYECPFCRRAHSIIKAVQKHFGKNLRFVFRNFPLAEMHPHAEMAAEAAEFGATENLFWPMHDLIYDNQENLGLPLLLELGLALKLPVQDLELAIVNRVFEPKIQSDFMGGVRSGVNGTPTFFINGQRFNGPHEFDTIVLAIDSIIT